MRAQDLVADWLAERIGGMLGADPNTIAPDAPFVELGLSSLQAVEISDDLERWTGLVLPPTLAYDHPTIEAAAEYVAEAAEREGRTISAAGARDESLG